MFALINGMKYVDAMKKKELFRNTEQTMSTKYATISTFQSKK
ncbi:hypothetical protein RUL31_21085 [Bacillus atrophaeus]|nr:hypothetical protein [Bacillus atrophaeus]WNV81885.1 hypothetical protein RUL31_21085 [Bacillus atrophaeus]